jgi:hypothetical protein
MEAVRGDERAMNFMKSPEQGAATTVWAAVSRDLEGRGGVCLENCTIVGPAPSEYEGYGRLDPGYAPWAYDPEGEEKLWQLSLEMTGLKE